MAPTFLSRSSRISPLPICVPSHAHWRSKLYDRWRAAGAIAAVRVNPLTTCGGDDLAVVLAGQPDIVMMSKVAAPEDVRALEVATGGAVELVPNIESAAGLIRTFDIVRASPCVSAALVASEDMVSNLGTTRSRTGEELAYVRARFLVECRAAMVEAIDCPYTFSDARGAAADARYAKRLGYRAKSLVAPGHAAAINRVFTPQPLKSRALGTSLPPSSEPRRRARPRAAGRRPHRGADLSRSETLARHAERSLAPHGPMTVRLHARRRPSLW